MILVEDGLFKYLVRSVMAYGMELWDWEKKAN